MIGDEVVRAVALNNHVSWNQMNNQSKASFVRKVAIDLPNLGAALPWVLEKISQHGPQLLNWALKNLARQQSAET